MILGFTVLALCLFGIALYFAFLYVRKDFTAAMRTQSRRHVREVKAVNERIGKQGAEIGELRGQIAKLAMTPNRPSQPGNNYSTPFSRAEDRIEKELKNAVVINDTPVNLVQ